MSYVGGSGSGPTPTQFAAWVEQHGAEDRGEIFHVIDSLVRTRDLYGNIPPVELFGFSAGISPVAPQIHSYLAAIPPQNLLTEVNRFAHLRPEATVAAIDRRSMDQETQQQAMMFETLLQDKDHSFKAIIVDYNHYLAMRDQYVALNDKKGKTAVPDVTNFPADPASQRELVEELFAAILDFDNVIDGQRQKRVNKRKTGNVSEEAEEEVRFADSTHVRRVKEASNLEIELLSWELVFATRDAQDGRVKMAPWGPEWHYDRFDSFKERFERVKYACRHSKSTVNGLMTRNFAQRLAAAPDNEYRRKVQNLDINRTRDAQVKAGIQALKSGQIRVAEDLSLISASGGTIAPGHPGSAQLNQERRKIVRHKYTSDAARTSRLSTVSAPGQMAPSSVAPGTMASGQEVATEDFGMFALSQTRRGAREQVEFAHAEDHGSGPASNPSGQSSELEDIIFNDAEWGRYFDIGDKSAEPDRGVGRE